MLVLIGVSELFIKATEAFACPGCGEAMDATVGRGFNMSIAFMMSMPFLVFGSLLLGVIFVVRSKRGKWSTTKSHQVSTKREEN